MKDQGGVSTVKDNIMNFGKTGLNLRAAKYWFEPGIGFALKRTNKLLLLSRQDREPSSTFAIFDPSLCWVTILKAVRNSEFDSEQITVSIFEEIWYLDTSR